MSVQTVNFRPAAPLSTAAAAKYVAVVYLAISAFAVAFAYAGDTFGARDLQDAQFDEPSLGQQAQEAQIEDWHGNVRRSNWK